MPTTLDPPTTARRVLFLEGQVLVADDLIAEQDERNAHRRLHQATAHTPGIAHGLGLHASGGNVLIAPGYAVDGYGREVVVSGPLAVDVSGAASSVDVWLLYGREQGRSPGRWLERPESLATPTGLDDQHNPVPIPVAGPTVNLDIGHISPAPDDPLEEWPVYLGRVVKDSSGTWQRSDPPVLRPEIRAVGQLIRHPDLDPARRAEVLVGPATGVDRRRFAVLLGDGDDGWDTPLLIDRRGAIAISGPLTLEPAHVPGTDAGDPVKRVGPKLTLLGTNPDPAAVPGWDGRAPQPAGHLMFRPLPDVPTAARTWQAYAITPPPPPATPPPGPPPPPIVPALRFEIEHPGDSGDPSGYRFVIGRSGASSAERVGGGILLGVGALFATALVPPFVPILTVESDGDVTIHGDLVVVRGVSEGPIADNLNDPRFVQSLTQGYVQGLAAGAGALDTTSLAITFTLTRPATVPGTLNLSIKITNASAEVVRSITAYVTLSVAATGETLPGGGSAPPFDLGPNTFKDIAFTYNVTTAYPPNALVVGVIASGVNALGGGVYQSLKQPS